MKKPNYPKYAYGSMMNSKWQGVSEELCEEDKCNSSCENNFLERVDNHIYFYSDIERDKVLQLNRMLHGLSCDFIMMAREMGIQNLPTINLHVFSYGGVVHSGLAAMDAVLSCKVPVNTIIDGACASAATLITITGKRRYMNRNSFVLIHQISTFFTGKHEELKDEMYNSDKLMKILKNIYSKYTKMPMEILEQIIHRDIQLDAEECLAYGIIDEIIDS